VHSGQLILRKISKFDATGFKAKTPQNPLGEHIVLPQAPGCIYWGLQGREGKEKGWDLPGQCQSVSYAPVDSRNFFERQLFKVCIRSSVGIFVHTVLLRFVGQFSEAKVIMMNSLLWT